MHEKDRSLIQTCQDFFCGIGTISKPNSTSTVEFRVNTLKNIVDVIIPLSRLGFADADPYGCSARLCRFEEKAMHSRRRPWAIEKYPLISKKNSDYFFFLQFVLLMLKKNIVL